MTNREKFQIVFGFDPNDTFECIAPKEECKRDRPCCECEYMNFWDKEYKDGNKR